MFVVIIRLGFFYLDADITGYSLTSGAGFVIALGVIILLLTILGKRKKQKNFIDLLCFKVISVDLKTVWVY